MPKRFIDEDMARIRGTFHDGFNMEKKPNRVVKILYWGDEVDLVAPDEVNDESVRNIRVRYFDYPQGAFKEGTIRKRRRNGKNLPLRLLPADAPRPLAITFVDVQQGDAALIRTPTGRHLLVDGGEEVFIARLLASEYPETTASDPLFLDALVVTHGDADHFEGLAAVADAASHPISRKRVHVRVARCFHNGLVKKPGKIPDGSGGIHTLKERERFGAPVAHDGQHYVVDLHDDPASAFHPNGPFQRWIEALDQLLVKANEFPSLPAAAGETLPVLQRLKAGNTTALRVFQDEGMTFQILGPVEKSVNGQPALEILRDGDGAQSASHTINGHSMILRLGFGNVHVLMGGDLNRDGAAKVLEFVNAANPQLSLRSEIFKVPHHGSHEYSREFLAAVAPIVSVVSSGDENPAKEYIHPRANLMAALGQHSRSDEPLLFSTELAAFFTFRGGIQPEQHREKADGSLVELGASSQRGFFFAFERLRFGVIRVRTDGERVFVAPESASDRIKEGYAIRIDADGNAVKDDIRIV